MNMNRGYFGIGIYHGKSTYNVGTLWRGAFQLGASILFTIGRRYPNQASDTVKAWRHIPLFEFPDWETFLKCVPRDCRLIGVEIGGKSLPDFTHPDRALYILGAEDHGLPPVVLQRCGHTIEIPSARIASYNVAQAGTLVLYDRFIKCA